MKINFRIFDTDVTGTGQGPSSAQSEDPEFQKDQNAQADVSKSPQDENTQADVSKSPEDQHTQDQPGDGGNQAEEVPSFLLDERAKGVDKFTESKEVAPSEGQKFLEDKNAKASGSKAPAPKVTREISSKDSTAKVQAQSKGLKSIETQSKGLKSIESSATTWGFYDIGAGIVIVIVIVGVGVNLLL